MTERKATEDSDGRPAPQSHSTQTASRDAPSDVSASFETARAPDTVIYRHTRLVRITHWINAISFLLLILSGIAILLAHPEFYWGETGYFGEPTAFSLPLTPNFFHTGWGRTLHFFFAWTLVLNGAIYLLCGLVRGHFRRSFLPTTSQLRPGHLLHEVREHLRFRPPRGDAARQYNVLQKLSYLLVVFLLLPLMLLTGLTMSPAVTSAWPELFSWFGGRQSARTIHFIVAGLLAAFLLVHIVQVFVAGFTNEMRSMINGRFVIEPEDR